MILEGEDQQPHPHPTKLKTSRDGSWNEFTSNVDRSKDSPNQGVKLPFRGRIVSKRKLGLKIKGDHGRKDVEIGSDVGSKLPDDGT